MKNYSITIRQSTVTFTLSIWACSSKRMRKYLKKIIANNYQGFSIYKIHRTF